MARTTAFAGFVMGLDGCRDGIGLGSRQRAIGNQTSQSGSTRRLASGVTFAARRRSMIVAAGVQGLLDGIDLSLGECSVGHEGGERTAARALTARPLAVVVCVGGRTAESQGSSCDRCGSPDTDLP